MRYCCIWNKGMVKERADYNFLQIVALFKLRKFNLNDEIIVMNNSDEKTRLKRISLKLD